MKPTGRPTQDQTRPDNAARASSLARSRSPHNLPLHLTSFIGRRQELAEVKELLTITRLLTLTGPGGSGKSRLASQTVTDLLSTTEYLDGIRWVELSHLNDPELVPQAVATALSVLEQPGHPLVETILDDLRLKQVLLVLDNCEHLVSACAWLVNKILRLDQNVGILATSRVPLRIEGEIAWPVPPLATPTPEWWTKSRSTEAQMEALARFEAVQLFTIRAATVLPAFHLSAENAAAVAQICYRLDGLPLAIELAATRLKVLSAAQIAERLDKALALLTRGSPLAARRHQTLRATLDWSYDLLTAREQALLCRLAVFAGGFTLEAAEGICPDETLEPAIVLDTLSNLVDQSLVVVERPDDSRPWYRLPETIRQYSQEKLQAAAESRLQLRDRHLAWYQALAEEAETGLRGSQQGVWLERLEREHDNLRAALDWSQEAGQVERGLRLAASLHWFWDRRGYLSEGRVRLQALLERSREQAASSPPSASFRQAQAYALYGAASLAFDQGDREASAALAAESVALFRQLNDPRGLALALPRLAFGRGLASDEARQLLAESLEIAQVLNEVWLLGLNHMLLGQIAFFQGEYQTAQAELEAGLVLLRRSEDSWGLVHVLSTLGLVKLALGEFEAARSYLEESLLTARNLGDTRSIALVAAATADVARCRQDYDRAAELYAESLALYRKLGNQAEIPAIWHNQGYVALGQGNYEAARVFFTDSLQQQLERGNRAGLAEGLAGLAALAGARAAPERAAQLFGAAAAIRKTITAPVWPAERFEVERHEAALHVQLDVSTLARLQAAGQALTWEQAVAYALQEFRQEADGLLSSQTVKQHFGGLTAREREVATLIAQGHSNRAIAAALVITERTAERHVANILAKLGFTSRVQIAAWAVQKGLNNPRGSS